MSETYSVNVKCSNCDYVGTIELPKGTPVPHGMECPHCGCNTASKDTHSCNIPFPVPRKLRRVIDDTHWISPYNKDSGPYILSDNDRPRPTVTLENKNVDSIFNKNYD